MFTAAISRLIRPPALLALAILCGCAAGPQLRDYGVSGQAVEMREVPSYRQDGYQGGPAALAMMLAASGAQAQPEQLVDLVSDAKTGTSSLDAMSAAANRYGRIAYELKSNKIDLEVVHQLQSGRPVLVLLHSGLMLKQWQYAVLIGVDPAASTFTLRSGAEQRQVLSYADFLAAWRDSAYRGLLILRPGDIPPDASPSHWLGAAQQIEQAGKLEAASEAYAAIARRWPDTAEEAEAWGGLGRIYYALHNLRGATIAFSNAITRQPKNPAYHHGLAQTLFDRQCADQAEDEVDLAMQLEPDPKLRELYMKTQKEVEQHSGPSVTCPLE